MNRTIQQTIQEGIRKFGDKPYIYERRNNEFVGHSYKHFAKDVESAAAELSHFGDSKIAIFAKNSYRYMVADAAIMGFLPAICVAISKDWQYYDVKNAISFLGISAIIYGEEQTSIIQKLKVEFPALELIPIETLGKNGIQFAPATVDSSVCAKIVFTSGTTSTPKAVMLSQDNMFALYNNLMSRTPLDETDSNYLFLPLHHVYAGICVFLYSLVSGMSIYLCSDNNEIIQELAEVQPTSFCAVSLIYERIHAYCIANHISPQAIFGEKIKYLYCGAANFNPEVKRWLKENHMPIIHSYGMTETSSLIALEYPENHNPLDTVGTICEDIELKIDHPNPDGLGEILVKGKNVFLGYYGMNNANYFDTDGFFRTGDLGYTKGKLLFVSGRKKRVILLSNGENIYPDDIEKIATQFPDIEKATVYLRNNLLHMDITTTGDSPKESLLEKINECLPKYSKIKSCAIITKSADSVK